MCTLHRVYNNLNVSLLPCALCAQLLSWVLR